MIDKQAYFPPPPSSLRLQQQERQLQKYHSTTAVVSNRERDRLEGRLSPEPHLEIMRPVSPFQCKRQFVHQQPQPNLQPAPLNSHYHSQPNSQPYTHGKPSPVQEMAASSTFSPNTRSKPGAYKREGRSARGMQKDSDISPALKLMSYDTAVTPPSSDGGHGRSTHSHSSREAHGPQDRSEQNRSTSPEGGKRKNPSWRKPAPKYIPTPPSTPPPSGNDRLPSSTTEPVPPVPSSVQPIPTKIHSVPAPLSHVPPPRPARAETVHHMFRDLTGNLDSSRARIVPTHGSQQSAQLQLTPKASASATGSLRPGQNHPQPPSRTQTLFAAQVQSAAQVPAQAHTTTHVHPRLSFAPAQLVAKGPDARSEQRSPLVQPQPKRVPSMPQLVAMVLPSRTPSPKILAPTDNCSPSPPKTTMAAQSQSHPLSPKLTMLDMSSRTPSPAVHAEANANAAATRVQAQPHQVLLPPSTESSAKSSRSVSPRSSPPPVSSSLPIRSRSPTPVIPQYAPPPPPFPPPPPNTPVVAPKPREVVPLQSQLSSHFVEQTWAVQAVPTTCAATGMQHSVAGRQITPPPSSGLVTPPITPPSTTACRTATKLSDSVVPTSSAVAASIVRSRGPTSLPSFLAPVLAAQPVHKSATTVQQDYLARDEDKGPKEGLLISRPTIPAPMLAPPALASIPIDSATEEDHTPPLPMDWKETISRVVRSSVSPNLPMPATQVVEFDENSSILPPIKSTAQVLPEDKDYLASAYVITGTWLEQVEHATAALEFHTHEVDASRMPVVTDANLPLNDKKEQSVQSGHFPLAPQASPTKVPVAMSAIKQRVPYDPSHLPSTIRTSPEIPAESPPRSRSPVPRSKTPQHVGLTSVPVECQEESWSLISPESDLLMVGLSSSSPLTSRQVESTSRSHSSGPRKRAKTPRPRGDEDWATIQRQDARQEASRDFSLAETGTSPRAVAVELPPARCVSPPPRNQSLGNKKRLPPVGSDSGHVESNAHVSNHVHPSSPPTASRSLSPSPHAQAPAKSSRGHVHGQHKRLPALEVTQQAYRPPTPPIPSHYRKKRSYDLLPSEPFAAFIKPPVHVIYPDTSTSHGHSLSGDSVLGMGMSRPKSPSNPKRGHACPEERERPRSPSLLSAASLDKEQDGYEGVEEADFPQVPPKTQRSDVTSHGPPVDDEPYSDFAIQHAMRERYPSAPIGQARAHTLTFPPSSNRAREARSNRTERSPSTTPRTRRTRQPHATKATRSASEKVARNNNVQPLARSKSSPLPSSRNRQRGGFWRLFGMWARIFMAKFKTWASPSPSPSQSPMQGRYYDDY